MTHTISIEREDLQRAEVVRELPDCERQPELWRAPTNPIPITLPRPDRYGKLTALRCNHNYPLDAVLGANRLARY